MKKHLIFLSVAFGPNVYAGCHLSLESKSLEAQELQVQPLSPLSFSQFKKDFLEASVHKRIHIDDKNLALFLYATYEDEYGRIYIQGLDHMTKYCDSVPKIIMQKCLRALSKEDSFFLIAQPMSRQVLEAPGFVVEYPEMDPFTGKELYRYSKISENGINKALEALPQKDESPSIMLFKNALLAQKDLYESKWSTIDDILHTK